MPTNPDSINHTADVMVVDDEIPNLQLLTQLLSQEGYRVRPAENPQLALESAQAKPPSVILLDVKMPEMDGFEVCRRLKEDAVTRDIPIIFVSALHDVQDKVRGFEAGGVDFISKPFHEAEILARVQTHTQLHNMQLHLEELVAERTVELKTEIEERKRTEQELLHLKDQLREENIYLREEIQLEHNFKEIIGNSKGLRYVLFRIEQIASTDTTVLVLGKTGTGKELIARAIHNTSSRKGRPLIKVNCAALPAQLIESELFGHEKGAFTGATGQRIGRFELADRATLFLDEIGELPLELQSKLLRVLQDGEFERLGSSRTRKVDVRLIAATNRDLETEIQSGRFRQDLFYRLNIYTLTLPPLRERREDIMLLVEVFIKTYNKKLGKSIELISQKTTDALMAYAWPGNIRELQNVIEKAVILAQDRTLRVELPEIKMPKPADEPTQTLAEIDRDYIQQILKIKNWRIEGPEGAAVVLDLNPGTLRSRMQKLGIKRPS